MMRPPSGISFSASRTPTRNALACEFIAASHCSRLIVIGGSIERADFGARIGDEDVEAAELVPDAVEQALDLRRLADVGLDGESVGAPRTHLLERCLGRRLVLQVVDGDVHAMLGELQRDPAADAARAAGHECVSGCDGHGCFS